MADEAEKSEGFEDFFAQVLSVIGKTTVEEVAALLKQEKKTVAVAESLTGGLISALLTSQPGSSDYFVGGIVCYSPRVKVMEVGVPASLIARQGTVSEEVALAMAEGIRKKFHAGIGLAATGVSGPATVSPPKPVGLTYVALSSLKGTEMKKLELQGTRSEIREKAAQAALGLLWLHLGGEEVVYRFGGPAAGDE